MLISELLENFQLLTRDHMGNYLSSNVDKIMNNIDLDKVITKQYVSRAENVSLILHPILYSEFFEETNKEFRIILFNDKTAVIHETFYGEAIPALRFLLSRWPSYSDFKTEDGETLAEIANKKTKDMSSQTHWYHGTTSKSLLDIRRFGLVPKDVSQRNYSGLGGSETGLVYLGSDEDVAKFHAQNAAKKFGGAPVVLKINLQGLENKIVDDHDVRYTTISKSSPHDKRIKRIRNVPGLSSFLTLGTIAVKGRIPANRIEVVWTGKERKGRLDDKKNQYEFVTKLSMLAKNFSRDELYTFFHIIGMETSGIADGKWLYSKNAYAEPDKAVYSVYAKKLSPRKFSRWINGMKLRSSRWRKSPSDNKMETIKLIDDAWNKFFGQNHSV